MTSMYINPLVFNSKKDKDEILLSKEKIEWKKQIATVSKKKDFTAVEYLNEKIGNKIDSIVFAHFDYIEDSTIYLMYSPSKISTKLKYDTHIPSFNSIEIVEETHDIETTDDKLIIHGNVYGFCLDNKTYYFKTINVAEYIEFVQRNNEQDNNSEDYEYLIENKNSKRNDGLVKGGTGKLGTFDENEEDADTEDDEDDEDDLEDEDDVEDEDEEDEEDTKLEDKLEDDEDGEDIDVKDDADEGEEEAGDEDEEEAEDEEVVDEKNFGEDEEGNADEEFLDIDNDIDNDCEPVVKKKAVKNSKPTKQLKLSNIDDMSIIFNILIEESKDIITLESDLHQKRQLNIKIFKTLDLPLETIQMIEKGIYNYSILKCNIRLFIPLWDNLEFIEIYVSKSKNLYSNLNNKSYVKNMKLIDKVKSGEILPYDLAFMDTYKLFPEMWVNIIDQKTKVEKMINDSLLECASDLFECPKCNKREVTYYQLQIRSSDEPATNFVNCMKCGHKWTVE